jgi:ankyrin repeat protein
MSASDSSRLPSLERLRKEAKMLARACRAGDPEALARVRAGASPQLADVQRALAREHGFPTWAGLKREVLAREPMAAHAARFLAAVRHGLRERAANGLVAYPGMTRVSVHAAAAAADAQALNDSLLADPARVAALDEPDHWPPLHYACASPSSDEDAVTRAVELLLAHGADPSSTVRHGEWSLSALYRALEGGHRGAARGLLEHGANPNDGESVYHMAEHDDRESLELLLAHGAELSTRQEPYGNTPLFFLAGYREGNQMTASATRGMRWLLEHGADPNVTSGPTQETALHRVIEFGGSAAVIEMLLEFGADPLLARADGRTPYLIALRAGHEAALELLRARGAVTADISHLDRFFAACAQGDHDAARTVLDEHPDLIQTLPRQEKGALAHAAENGQIGAVRVLAAFGFDPAWEGPGAGTALHHAAWRGNVALVELLLDLGAPVNMQDREFGSSPIGWAAHGSAHCRSADEDYAAIIERLLAAGSRIEFALNREGKPPDALASPAVAQLLRERGFVPAS